MSKQSVKRNTSKAASRYCRQSFFLCLFNIGLIAARVSGGALKLPQRVRAEPGLQTYFWCILGMHILHLFEYLNDEEFPVICSPFEGRFHSSDFSFSTWTLRGRRPGCIGSRSGWTASMTVHPHFKHWFPMILNFIVEVFRRSLNSFLFPHHN